MGSPIKKQRVEVESRPQVKSLSPERGRLPGPQASWGLDTVPPEQGTVCCAAVSMELALQVVTCPREAWNVAHTALFLPMEKLRLRKLVALKRCEPIRQRNQNKRHPVWKRSKTISIFK